LIDYSIKENPKENNMFTKSKTIKLILALFLAISMVVTVACNDDKDDDEKDSAKTTVSSTSKTKKTVKTEKAEKTTKKASATTKKAKATTAKTQPVSGVDFDDYDGYWGTTLNDQDFIMYLDIDSEEFFIVVVDNQSTYDTGEITLNDDDGTITLLNQDDEVTVFEYDSDEDILLNVDTEDWEHLTDSLAESFLEVDPFDPVEQPTATFDVTGKWTISAESFAEVLESFGITEELLETEEFAGFGELVDVSMTFKADNTCDLTAQGVTEKATWEYAGAGINLTTTANEQMYLIYNASEDTLSVDEEGIILAFERNE
jgi:hypothetical protein